jgi:hypothetical protein
LYRCLYCAPLSLTALIIVTLVYAVFNGDKIDLTQLPTYTWYMLLGPIIIAFIGNLSEEYMEEFFQRY